MPVSSNSGEGLGKLLYAVIATFIGVVFFGCLFLCKLLSSSEPEYSAVDLEEVRIDRQRAVEGRIMSKIEALQRQLLVQRRKRTLMETSNELAKAVEERVERIEARGRALYGDAWDQGVDGNVPLRELMTIPEDEMRQLRIEAQNRITQRQAEEKFELQQLTARGLLQPPVAAPQAHATGLSVSAAASELPDVMLARTRRRYQQPPACAQGAFVDDRFIPTPRTAHPPVIEYQAKHQTNPKVRIRSSIALRH